MKKVVKNKIAIQKPPYKKIRVTLDTSVLDSNKQRVILDLLDSLGADVALTSISEREIYGTDISKLGETILETAVWNESQWDHSIYGESINEALVLDESRLGSGTLGAHENVNILERILNVISNGSFPKPENRSMLTRGEKHQLRDAMILEAHIRERRDVFISDDKKAYVGANNSKRIILESICTTKIFTFKEFVDWAGSR